jgi:quinolinate synthase
VALCDDDHVGPDSGRLTAAPRPPAPLAARSAPLAARSAPLAADVTTFAEPSPTATALLLLGRGSDAASEKGVDCPGDLPAPSDPDLVARAVRAKAALGDRVFVLGHHYQRDEVIEFADVTGDSFKLARDAAARPEAEFIVFCGVHFMAESADILTGDAQQVVLPDLGAGCSMADMAVLSQVEAAWDRLTDVGIADCTVPVTYMNSSADIKGFVGRRGGVVCTSSNAKQALTWAFEQGTSEREKKVLFLPDQHLGRNTAVLEMGFTLDDCVLYDPHKPGGGLTDEQLLSAKVILWRGHCSVHGRFTLDCVREVRDRVPGVNVLVHPECRHEVVTAADYVGSTEYIIKTIGAAPAGSAWAVGTELNLVRRLANAHPDKQITFLDRTVCYCSTMNRIDLPHLVWALEELVAGRVPNRIAVDPRTAHYARVALDQMLALP